MGGNILSFYISLSSEMRSWSTYPISQRGLLVNIATPFGPMVHGRIIVNNKPYKQ